jgi:hypothetical protein
VEAGFAHLHQIRVAIMASSPSCLHGHLLDPANVQSAPSASREIRSACVWVLRRTMPSIGCLGYTNWAIGLLHVHCWLLHIILFFWLPPRNLGWFWPSAFLVNQSICPSKSTYILIIKAMRVHKIMSKSANCLFYFILFG